LAVLLTANVLPTDIGLTAEVAIIPVNYRKAQEVLPTVEKLLSKEGTVSADHRTNSLVVSDSKAHIRKIKNFLTRFDQPGQQVKVWVSFEDMNSAHRRYLEMQGAYSGKNWRIGTGRRKTDGMDVRVQDGTGLENTSDLYQITVMSGSSAYIAAGKEIPVTRQWIDLCRRYGGVVNTVDFKIIETGFEVTPVVSGNYANIDIMPRISSLDSENSTESQVIRFTQASTSLRVRIGQWVNIAGSSRSRNEVMQAILKGKADSSSRSMQISVKVDAQ
jgi:type II secretory pathway component GspD/PulD (secretin)